MPAAVVPRLRPLVVVLLLLLPVLLAACTLPEETDPRGRALVPAHDPVAGLTPEHARSHPVALLVTENGTRAFVALAGTIARPDARVAVLDLERGRLLAHIDVGSRPLDIVPDPRNEARAFVTHPYHPSITVLDLDAHRNIGALPVPYYVEHVAIAPDGDTLVATDRDQDRLLVYGLERDNAPRGTGYALRRQSEIRTGPNPEWVTFVDDSRLVAVSDRHGASVTLIDLDTERARRVDLGGAPVFLTAHDRRLLVAGYGPGNGTSADVDGTNETGTADVQTSLLVLDLASDPGDLVRPEAPIPTLRYVPDTARPDHAPDDTRLLAGADLRHISVVPRTGNLDAQCGLETALVLTYHGSDQVQILCLARDGTIVPDTWTRSTREPGTRVSPLPLPIPLTPGNLSAATNRVYETPPGPRASHLHGELLFTVAEFPELVHVTDTADCPHPTSPRACRSVTIPVVADALPYPTGIFEEGERLFHSAIPSADQDRSCASCHIDGLATGGTWALPHRDLTPVRIPRLDDTADNAPWLLDGSARGPSAYLDAAGGDLLRPDPDDPNNLATDPDPANATLPAVVPGRTNGTLWMQAVFAYLVGETRLLPAPPRLTEDGAADARDGRKIFVAPAAQCMSCHADTGRATLLDAEASRGIPRPPGAERIKAPSLDGLWDRTGTPFLWSADARTLAGALLLDGHECLDGTPGLAAPWHGNAMDRQCAALADLTLHLMTLDGRR